MFVIDISCFLVYNIVIDYYNTLIT